MNNLGNISIVGTAGRLGRLFMPSLRTRVLIPERPLRSQSQQWRPSALATALVLLLLAGCGETPHAMVVRNETAKLQQYLNQHPEAANTPNNLKKTPLHIAVSLSRMDAAEVLLAHGANLEAQDRTGMTPLHVAAMMESADAAVWLLDHGAALAPVDQFGDTPVHTAALFGQTAILQLLVQRGAKLTAVNAAGKTPLDLALANRQTTTAAAIKALLARKQSG